VAWITALKTGAIRSLVDGGHLQLGIFDERNLFELEHPDFPGQRLIACKNHDLAKLRSHKRQSLLEATERELTKVANMAVSGRLRGKDAIGVRIGRVINKYKMAKHFELTIGETSFKFKRRADAIDAEATLDGIYIVRTPLTRERCSAAATVRSYKLLSYVERAFRSIGPSTSRCGPSTTILRTAYARTSF
jgi:hypothetical protein